MYMTMQPAHDATRSGYAARRKSPVGIGGAIAVHAVVVGAFLLMPKEIIDWVRPTPPITGYPVPLPPPPEPITPEPTQQTVQTNPLPQKPTTTDPIVPMPVPTGPMVETGPSSSLDGSGTGTVIDPPLPPPHIPVLVDASIAPNALGSFQPDYPGAMIRQGLEGNVTVRVTISPEGRVTDIVKVSATDESFWLATQKHALRKWRFRPATRDGVAVSSVKTLTVRFTLTDR